MSLHDKVAIVTGASRWIGAGIARAFANDGCLVAGIARDAEALNVVAEDIESRGGKFISFIADVKDSERVEIVVYEIMERTGRIDILVNNEMIASTIST